MGMNVQRAGQVVTVDRRDPYALLTEANAALESLSRALAETQAKLAWAVKELEKARAESPGAVEVEA